ncbi:MAG: hypothetical protein ABI068_07035 [Ktedonobacterales bacterium]
MERRILGAAGGLLRHALGFMLLGWQRMLRGALIAALIIILVTEIAAMIITHSWLPGAPAQLVAAALAFVVAYITALTIFIWELAAGLIDLIRVAEGEVEAGAHAATVIAERELGDVYAGLRRFVGLSAHPQSPASGNALSATHPDVMPTSETLAALAPLAARAIGYHQRQQTAQAAAAGEVVEQPNVVSVTQLPQLPMNPVPAASLPRIEWTYEHFIVKPSAPANDTTDDALLQDAPLVEPLIEPSAAPVASESATVEASPAPAVDTANHPATIVVDAPDAADMSTISSDTTVAAAASDADTTLPDVSRMRAALHLSPMAPYVAPLAAPLAELATSAAVSALAHAHTTQQPHYAMAAPATTPLTTAGAADPDAADSAVANVATSEVTAPDAATATHLEWAEATGEAADDGQQTQPDLAIVAPRPQAPPRPALEPATGYGFPSAATQPSQPDSQRNTRPITRPLPRATSPLTRPRTERTRITRPVTRPLPAQTAPRPTAPDAGGGLGLWERLSQALVGRTPTPTTPRPTGANTSQPFPSPSPSLSPDIYAHDAAENPADAATSASDAQAARYEDAEA